MSLEAARDLSIEDLLHVLNEKIGLECTRVLEIPLPPVFPPASLDTEIERIETRARDLLRFAFALRNLLQPINRLPPEILSRIARNIRDNFDMDTRSIVPLTHVCRYWRESIVSTPENWTTISSNSNKLAALSLERAKAAPLDIYLDFRTITTASFNLLGPHLKNAGSCRVRVGSIIETVTFGFPGFPWSMPKLRALELSKYGGTDLDRSFDPFKSSSCTTNQLRNLRYLKLIGVPLYPSFLCLRTLVKLYLHAIQFNLHLDTLLNFLEENRSLETANLGIGFVQHSLRGWQRRATIGNQFRCLSIRCPSALDARALISSIALPKGAHLELDCYDKDAGLDDILSGVSTTHLSNLSSPTTMKYRSYTRHIQLLGPDGSASFTIASSSSAPFAEFPLLPFANVRQLNLAHHMPPWVEGIIKLSKFRPSLFPALETLTITHGRSISHVFSMLWSNPSSCPSLRTLAFMDCAITEEFMGELTQYASDRKDTVSVRLHRVVIVHPEGRLPSTESVRGLGKHVPVVDVRKGTELPMDLT